MSKQTHNREYTIDANQLKTKFDNNENMKIFDIRDKGDITANELKSKLERRK